VPALPSSILEPLWGQFAALLPERHDTHPLGCHRPRIPDRVIFDELIQVLVFGCAYERIADHTCSERTFVAAATNGSRPGPWPAWSASRGMPTTA
jgi:hypothetical protein